ncbi:MAG: hypothetical protein LBP60_05900, partial [Spirochaetaceae bacterium]|nr:hypothetical protein [Spirochaetaceae bacterium]
HFLSSANASSSVIPAIVFSSNFDQGQKIFPAFHCMEYVYGIFINNIIKDFKRAALPVKTDKQIFVFVLSLALIKPSYDQGKTPFQRLLEQPFEDRLEERRVKMAAPS